MCLSVSIRTIGIKRKLTGEKLFELNLNFKSVAVPEAAASVSM